MRYIDIPAKYSSSGKPEYHVPMIFRGDMHQVYTDVDARHSTKGAVGDKVTLIYRPGAPNEAQRADFWNLWKTPVILLCLGAIILPLGTKVLLMVKSE